MAETTPPVDNPFSTPDTGIEAGAARMRRPHLDPAIIAAARIALARHLADPHQVAADRHLAGGLLSPRTGWMALAALSSGMFAAGTFSLGGNVAILGGFGSLICLVLIVVFFVWLIDDLRIVPRPRAIDANRAIRSWFRAAASGRGGYLVAALCPTARAVPTAVPDLDPVIAGGGPAILADAASARRWAKGFAASSAAQVRWQQITRLTIDEQDGDLAVASVTLSYRSWPQWANYVSLLLVLTMTWFYLIGLVAAILMYYGLRRSTQVQVTKTLLRGSDRAWYLVSADLFDEVAA